MAEVARPAGWVSFQRRAAYPSNQDYTHCIQTSATRCLAK
jgi:hypothetical protein